MTITGPENVTVSRGRDTTANTVTTTTQNSTTNQSTTEVLHTDTLASSLSGNATEPWNVTYSFPGGGWKKTVTHGTDSALSASTSFDPLGRVIEEDTPSPHRHRHGGDDLRLRRRTLEFGHGPHGHHASVPTSPMVRSGR